MRKVGAVTAAAVCATTLQAVALGAGPSPGLAQHGIVRGDVRYEPIGIKVAAIDRETGRTLRSKTFRRTWGIPLVAFDGTAGGLSEEGRALVLSGTNGGDPPAPSTSFFFLHTAPVCVLRDVRLEGGWGVDALSP